MLTLLFNQPAAGGAVTATLSATLADATLSSSSTVTPAAGAVTATLAATLEDATLASTATVASAGAVTATLAVTLDDATLSSTATVPAAPVAVQTATGGGRAFKSWKRKRREEDALQEAIRAALGEPADSTPTVVEPAAPQARQKAPQRDWTLPQAQDYSTEAAHIAALTQAVASIADAYSRAQAAKARDELTARRKAKVAKVRKLLMLVDLMDAA